MEPPPPSPPTQAEGGDLGNSTLGPVREPHKRGLDSSRLRAKLETLKEPDRDWTEDELIMHLRDWRRLERIRLGHVGRPQAAQTRSRTSLACRNRTDRSVGLAPRFQVPRG